MTNLPWADGPMIAGQGGQQQQEHSMFTKVKVAVLGIGLELSAWTAFPDHLTMIQFSVDWKLQGIRTGFFWAKEKGYFAQEKLDVQIDQGEGSAGAVTRVMSGAYDAAFGDANAVIQNAATKPSDAPLIVYMMYSRAPFALLTKAGSSIHTIKDLEGKEIGAPAAG